MSVVDHTDVFAAQSCVPRKDLYRDQVHPSDRGTNRLVFYLHLGTGAHRRPAQLEHQPLLSMVNTTSKPTPKGHTTVTFRSFKHFSETNFLFDLSQQPFRNVCTHCDPEEALALLYDIFKKLSLTDMPLFNRRE